MLTMHLFQDQANMLRENEGLGENIAGGLVTNIASVGVARSACVGVACCSH